jgi:hypothetical protein
MEAFVAAVSPMTKNGVVLMLRAAADALASFLSFLPSFLFRQRQLRHRLRWA